MTVPISELSKILLCLHGRKEVVVECEEPLLTILKNLPSEYLQPRLNDIKKYLDDNSIPYIEDFKSTSKV